MTAHSETSPARPRRLVLKVGSRLLTEGTERLQRTAVERIVDAVAGHPETETVLVTSGAVASGYSALGLRHPPADVPRRQAAAAVGQAKLMQLYAELFEARGLRVGQILLTHDVLRDRQRFVHARNTLSALFGCGILPIVNENDTLSVPETRVGDNDNIAAYTAALVDADVLVLLTDVDGVYDGDPSSDRRARVIPWADDAAALRRYCFRKESSESVGGMTTKLEAAEMAASYGIPTVIASGVDPSAVAAVYGGEPTGTRIAASPNPLRPRKHWVANHLGPAGTVVVDEGAARALRSGVTSLLPSGVREVTGRFVRGDVVTIVTEDGGELARGIARYTHGELRLAKGRHSREVPEILGVPLGAEVVHAEDLVLTEGGR